MRLVFAGTPDVAVPSLRALLDSDRHEVVAVVSRPDARTGRGRGLSRSPVAAAADAAGIEVLTPPNARDSGFAERLRELAPDAVPVVAYGHLVPRPVLDIPAHGWINLHFSLLPAWRGAAPVNAAIAAGDEVTGATTFRLDEGMDTGPVLGTMTETIRPRDTAGDLLGRLSESGAGLLVATLDGLEAGELRPVPQPTDGVSHAGKLTVDDARVRWSDPALAVDRHIRSVTPAPGAWTTLGGERVKIGSARPAEETAPDLEPGRIAWDKKAVHVGTASAPMVLETIQPPGKRMMDALNWVRGARLDAEAAFE
ncbi:MULTISPECIES: methionyl-tRNA formyltransferase [Dietzia]|uniref:Methionyl-tRNA formyltransferase n=1 Tax=Dietzia cinnamea TaxID=321318 RepID=A0A4R3ZZA2_9ACTN|nr:MULTISPECIES: methionyl-tRNA formyltransferase [Dietzia]MBB1021768.1 methionyl-tRNA formyltransferase [Dietzia sp. E1]MCT1711924.1 methionyl-tRNA formyltransferase [Dietzia cinnamea]MCT1884165.1 methionyl-tRNA formyltransferase [Dietzia cinnamea]MCT2139069.1 methionyl-tRNA formyltransferase [Dietzia cinnamea]MCT2274603.1 methionyl-tRNA formyltransferase [Dietzia cinnamea]